MTNGFTLIWMMILMSLIGITVLAIMTTFLRPEPPTPNFDDCDIVNSDKDSIVYQCPDGKSYATFHNLK